MSVIESSADAARRGIDDVERSEAFAELRIDALDEPTRRDPARIASIVEGRRVLLTHRRPSDGGLSETPEPLRVRVLADAARRTGAWCDIERDAIDRARSCGVDADRTVVSHHDLTETPSNLRALVDDLLAAPAAIAKIATAAVRTADLWAHVAESNRARLSGCALVPVAMGEKGVATRILGPAWGAPFTFCSRDAGRESAPGQVPVAVMRDRYRVPELSRASFVVGLVAGTTGYSRSPAMHNAALRASRLDGVYVPFAVDDLGGFLPALAGRTGRIAPWTTRGLSVTNPHKVAAMALVDTVDPLAARAGALNTIVVGADGRLAGYNTDVEGAMLPLEARVGRLAGVRVTVVGAGGAARAVVTGLADRGARVTVVARDAARARAIAEPFGAEWADLADVAATAPVVLVNATPVGTTGATEGESPVPAAALDGVRLVFDLVYKPRRTRLLADAGARGCATLDGLPMLATQAALQFELWTGIAVDPARMLGFLDEA